MSSSWTNPSHEPIGPSTLSPHPPPRPAKLPPNVVVVQPGLVEPVQIPTEPVSELERRRTITAAKANLVTAKTADAQAAQALTRAQRHVADCTSDFNAYGDVDTTLANHHVAALRTGDTVAEIPEYMRSRVTLRDNAKLTLDSANRAYELFSSEAKQAAERVKECQTSLDQAISALIGDYTTKLVTQWEDLTRQRDAITEQIFSADQAVSVPASVKSFIHARIAKDGWDVRLRDASKWKALRERLAADPEAELSLDARTDPG